MKDLVGFIVALVLFALSIWIAFRSTKKTDSIDTADSTRITADNNKKTIKK